MAWSKNADYLKGLADEQHLMELFRLEGCTVVESTKRENIYQDIDCYIDGVPVSIKSMRTAESTGNVAFESKVQKVVGESPARPKTDIKRYCYRWESSWLINGKADRYLLYTGTRLLAVNVTKLKEALRSGEAPVSVRGISWSTVQKQMEMGHPHHQSHLLLVPLDWLEAQPYTVDYTQLLDRDV